MSKPQSPMPKTHEEGLGLLKHTIKDLQQKLYNYSQADYAQEKYIADKQRVIDVLIESYKSLNCFTYSAAWQMMEAIMKDLEGKDSELSGFQFNFITKATGNNLGLITFNPLQNERF